MKKCCHFYFFNSLNTETYVSRYLTCQKSNALGVARRIWVASFDRLHKHLEQITVSLFQPLVV